MGQVSNVDVSKRHAGAMKLATHEQPLDTSGLRYDYEQIAEEHREQVMQAAVEIRRRERRRVEDAIAIGAEFIAVKAILPHGQFLAWVEAEFGYRPQMASEQMNIAERATKFPIIGNLNLTSARLLALPSVPDEAIEDALDAVAKKGAPLTVEETKHIIDLHKAPPKTISVQATVVNVVPEVEEISHDELEARAMVEAELAVEDQERAERDAQRAPYERAPVEPAPSKMDIFHRDMDAYEAEAQREEDALRATLRAEEQAAIAVPADTDMLQLTISRAMFRKLHVALLRGTRLKDMFTGEEMDRLNIIFSQALK